jgi:hypothetical protein
VIPSPSPPLSCSPRPRHKRADTAGTHSHTAVMSSTDDPDTANASPKQLAALLREARAVQRRLDKLATAAAGEDATTLIQLAEARDAVERLVDRFAHQERTQQRRAQEARRRQ